MKYCHICGNLIEDDSVITCPSCGRKQHSYRRPDGVVIDPYLMQAKKNAPTPVVEEILPQTPVEEEPVVEEPTPISEETKPEPAPAPIEKEPSQPLEEKTPAITKEVREKPRKKRKGLIIGVCAAVVGVLAIGAAAVFILPGMLNGGNGGDIGGGNTASSKPISTLAEEDPIGTWSAYEGSSLHYTFEADGTAKYWQTNYSSGELDWLYYGSWTRTGSTVVCKYTLYFNSGCMYKESEETFTVYNDFLENQDGGRYTKENKKAPVVDELCQVYDDAYLFNQSSGKTGHWIELGLNNVVVLRQYDHGTRGDFFKGTWSKASSSVLRITWKQKLANGTGTYQNISTITEDLTIKSGYLIWDGDNMYPATAPEKF